MLNKKQQEFDKDTVERQPKNVKAGIMSSLKK